MEIPPKGSNVCTCLLAGLMLATATFRSHTRYKLYCSWYQRHVLLPGNRGTSCVKDLPRLAARKRGDVESNLQPVDCKSSALYHYTTEPHWKTRHIKLCARPPQYAPPRPATEPRSGSLEPGRLSRARSANTRHPAGRPHTPPADRTCATDRRQIASSLNAPWAGP